jgi:predicted nucleic acid-binding protein
MTLVDTSIWVDHFRIADPRVTQLSASRALATHPFVIGELACGNLHDRARFPAQFLGWLRKLPEALMATDEEVHKLLESSKRWGKGLGWVDLHLLESARKSGFHLLTADRALGEAATALGVRTLSRGHLLN